MLNHSHKTHMRKKKEEEEFIAHDLLDVWKSLFYE